LWLSYFPVACGWLGWVALVPLLTLVRSPARPRAVYVPAWVAGLAFFWPALQWMRVADERMYATWAFLATYCALYFPLALCLVRFLERRTALPLLLTLPAVWTALEFFRSFFGTGFSWYLLGHSQHDFLPVIQVSDLTGAYGVSFLVVGVNVLLFEVLYSRAWLRTRFVGADTRARWGGTALLAQGVAVLVLMLATFAYGEWRLGQGAGEPGPRVALLQCNLDQRLKNTGDEDTLQLHEAPLARVAAEYHPDLIVWPETSFPQWWSEVAPGVPAAKCYNSVRERVAPYGTNVLLGLNSEVLCPDRHVRRYNSALLLDRDGRPAGRYDKIHRVPFGEYVPLVEWLPWMNRFAPYDFDYSVVSGTEHTRFPVAQASGGRRSTFGVVICYEDTDPDMARP
jgi:apolipoprotein N-acyltransferase